MNVDCPGLVLLPKVEQQMVTSPSQETSYPSLAKLFWHPRPKISEALHSKNAVIINNLTICCPSVMPEISSLRGLLLSVEW